jgi:hypothetical protein
MDFHLAYDTEFMEHLNYPNGLLKLDPLPRNQFMENNGISEINFILRVIFTLKCTNK